MIYLFLQHAFVVKITRIYWANRCWV